MKKSAHKFPATEWKKNEIRPCPTGKCKHNHLRKSGPCTEQGCGCHGAYVSIAMKKGRR